MQKLWRKIKSRNIDGLTWMDTSPNQEYATMFGNFSAVFWQFFPVSFIVLNSRLAGMKNNDMI